MSSQNNEKQCQRKPISKMHSGEATAKATPTGQPAGISGNKKVLKGQKGTLVLRELKTLMLLIDQAFMNMR